MKNKDYFCIFQFEIKVIELMLYYLSMYDINEMKMAFFRHSFVNILAHHTTMKPNQATKSGYFFSDFLLVKGQTKATRVTQNKATCYFWNAI